MPIEYTKNDDGKYVCGKCNIVKNRQNTMHYHLKKHEGSLAFECNICNKQFLHKNSLELHKEAKHTESRTKSISCNVENCEFTALTKANMLIHTMRIHHKKECLKILKKENGSNIHTCTKCSVDYKSGTAFYYHVAECLKKKKVVAAEVEADADAEAEAEAEAGG